MRNRIFCLVFFVMTIVGITSRLLAEESAEEILQKLAPLPFSQSKSIEQINKLNGHASTGSCRKMDAIANFQSDILCISSSQYRDLMQQQIANTSTFVIKNTPLENLPASIKERLPLAILAEDPKKKVSLTVTFGNDNLQMLGFGLIKDPDKKWGDDFFKTTSFGITLKEDLPSNHWLGEGVQLRKGFQSDLYTEYVKDSSRVKNNQSYDQQKARNLDVLSFVANNIKSGNVLFWEAGAGLISVNAESGPEKGISQQKAWHTFLNKVKTNEVTKHTNINENEKTHLSGFMAAYLGLQKTLQVSENCSIRGELKTGGRWAGQGLSNASISAEVSATQTLSNGHSVTPYIKSSTTLRAAGVGQELEVGGSYHWDKGRQAVGLMVVKNKGAQESPPGFDQTRNIKNGQLDSYFMAWYSTQLNP